MRRSVGAIRTDGRTSSNDVEQAELNELGRMLAEDISAAVTDCPVEAIRLVSGP